jgi:Tfp pilus assembly protein PilO
MNKDSLNKLIVQIKNPSTQIWTVIIVGLLFIILIFTSKIQPDFVEKTLLNQQIDNLEKQRNSIALSPLPVKVDEKAIQILIEQVPTEFEVSRLLLEFESIEKSTGSNITKIALGDQHEEVKDDLSDYIEKVMKKTPVAAAVPTTQIDSTHPIEQSTPVQEQPNLATPIKPELLSVHVRGTYDQVIDFMKSIYQMNRIVNIRTWSLNPVDDVNYAIEFHLSVYTAPKYAGSFHELPAIQTQLPNHGGKPVMSNEQFMEILQSQP